MDPSNDPKRRPSKNNRAKYRIEGKIGSIVGIALESAKPGDVFRTLTQFRYLKHPDTSNELTRIIQFQINNLLVTQIFPRILETFKEEEIPKEFALRAVYIELYGDETKNKISINEDTNFLVGCQIKKGVKISKNDLVKAEDVEYFTSIDKPEKDPNAATILLVQKSGEWFGIYDLIYNRQYVKEKVDRAIAFYYSAQDNFRKSNTHPFYESLWDCSELLIECLLLLHKQIKLGAEHKQIKKIFEVFCNAHKIEYFKDHQKISDIRNNSRYGPPHSERKDAIQESQRLLQSTYDFQEYVLSFLKERQVVSSHDQIKLNFSQIDRSS